MRTQLLLVQKHQQTVVTYDLEKLQTKNLDSTINKIKESNLMYDNDTISSSKNLTTVDIDNSIRFYYDHFKFLIHYLMNI